MITPSSKYIILSKLIGLILLLSTASVSAEIPIATLLSVNNSQYDNMSQYSATTMRQQSVNILLPMKNKADALKNQRILLNLFADTSYIAQLERVEVLKNQGIMWIGKIENIAQSEVIITIRKGYMIANITLPDTRYQIRYNGSNHVVREIDQSQFPDELESIPVNIPKTQSDTTGLDPNTAADSAAIIDVLVVYTTTAKTASGGQTAMENLIDLAIAETNIGYANSNVSQRLNLVHIAEVNYNESNFNWGTTLARLQNTSDNFIDNVHSLRDTYGADEVVLLVGATSGCGIAYVMDPVSSYFASSAFAVVSYNCATGYYSFAHELGHNMGSTHDRANTSNAAAFDYSYGYQDPNGAFRTIMSYNCPSSCTRRNYWSNPNVFINGQTTGVIDGAADSAFNAKSLNNTALTVANFRQSIPPVVPSSDDFLLYMVPIIQAIKANQSTP